MSKKQRILDLSNAGKTPREIAFEVYALSPSAPYSEIDKRMAYVRVVTRQRKGGGDSPAQKKYLKKRYGTKDLSVAYRLRTREAMQDVYADPVRYERWKKYHREYERARYWQQREAEARP